MPAHLLHCQAKSITRLPASVLSGVANLCHRCTLPMACIVMAMLKHTHAGMLWLWDLTATLGWQQRQSHDSGGSWHERASGVPWVGDEYFSDWPQQLGAWPCETSLPQTHIQNGGSFQLAGLCSDASEQDFITIARLLP